MNKVTPSIQDYLKAILELSKNGEPVHSVDVAAAIGVSRASVSRAMGVIKEAGYIKKERYGTILLTPLGRQTAKSVKKSNELIKAFLMDALGVDAETARMEACRMEHTISPETAVRLERYLTENGIQQREVRL